MPKAMAFIVCGHDECDGHLEHLATTGRSMSSCCGAEPEWSEFFRCPKCGSIYYGDLTGDYDLDMAHPPELTRYEGQLTAEEIVTFRLDLLGHFYPDCYGERQAMAKAHPTEFDRVYTVDEVARSQFGSEIVGVRLPENLRGLKVRVTVLRDQSGRS